MKQKYKKSTRLYVKNALTILWQRAIVVRKMWPNRNTVGRDGAFNINKKIKRTNNKYWKQVTAILKNKNNRIIKGKLKI